MHPVVLRSDEDVLQRPEVGPDVGVDEARVPHPEAADPHDRKGRHAEGEHRHEGQRLRDEVFRDASANQ